MSRLSMNRRMANGIKKVQMELSELYDQTVDINDTIFHLILYYRRTIEFMSVFGEFNAMIQDMDGDVTFMEMGDLWANEDMMTDLIEYSKRVRLATAPKVDGELELRTAMKE